jgi:hypothetical protein
VTTAIRRHYESSLALPGLLGPMQRVIPGAGAPVKLNTWTWGSWVAVCCPHCGCDPDKPCTIVLEDECGTATCVPAGPYGKARCSSCAR